MRSLTQSVAEIGPLLVLRGVALLSLFRGANAKSDNDDFANNLFSDIAPLLALFGEKFAQQFLSESFSWLDHIVFAMAPLGIITAIVGAIRIGGPPWMRAIIGRARENRASAEVELMSSTSHEVCELWNGESVVRTLGRPLVKQVAVVRREMKDKETFGLYTLETAQRDGIMEWKAYHGQSISYWLKTWRPSAPFARKFSAAKIRLGIRKKPNWTSWDVERGSNPDGPLANVNVAKPATGRANERTLNDNGSSNPDNNGGEKKGKSRPTIMRELGRRARLESAPNILLNLHHGSSTGDLIFAAVCGIAIQAGVLVFSGFATYSESLRLPGERTAYGFPLLASGTTLLTVGMIISCAIIEQSTTETIWRVKSRPTAPDEDITKEQDVRVLWLQKQHVVGDQSFDSFVLQAKDSSREVLTSRRSLALTERIVIDNDTLSSPLSAESTKTGLMERIIKKVGNTKIEFMTLLGALVGLCGFVLQFQGFRGMNWTCALAQLAAIGVMTAMRAWVRRGLVQRPRADRVIQDHEMDWLASNMASRRTQFWPDDDKSRLSATKAAETGNPHNKHAEFDASKNWTITFAYRGSLCPNGSADPEDFRKDWYLRGQQAVDIRRRLGVLTKWMGPVTEPAAAAAAAIKKVLDTVFPHTHSRFIWTLDMPFGGSISQIRITTERETNDHGENSDGASGGWKDISAEIQSVLSLWLFDIKSNSGSTDGDRWSIPYGHPVDANIRKRSRYILGPCTNGLKMDVVWWISNEIAPEERVEEYEHTLSSAAEFIAGYRNVRSQGEASLYSIPFRKNPVTTLNVPSSAKIELLLAQHIFAGFMWSVADQITSEHFARPITFDTKDTFNIYDKDTWDSCRLENPKLNSLLREVQRTGIGTLEETSLFMIPPLSCSGRLPSEMIVELVRQRVRENETSGHWEESIQVYSELIKLITVKGGVTGRLLYKAVAAVIEFLLIAQQSGVPDRAVDSLVGIKKGLMDKSNLGNGPSLYDVTVDLRELYKWQTRCEEYDSLFTDLLKLNDLGNGKTLDSKEEARLSHLFGYSPCHMALIHNSDKLDPANQSWRTYVLVGDILGWTPLHYAVLRNPAFYDTYAKLQNISARNDPRDTAERTPLHYAARAGSWRLGQSLRKHSDLNAQGRDGMLPLHWAAKFGNLVMTKMLLNNGSEVDKPDNYQKTPLFLAIESGHEAVVQALLERHANAGATLLNGETPLHRASQLGRTRIVQALLKHGAEAKSKGREGRSPLHLACKGGHTEIVRMLLDQNVDVSEYDDSTTTPLHIAAAGDHVEIVTLLLDRDAKINARNASQNTPLLETAWASPPAVNVARALLERGADLTPRNKDGYHPILLSSSSPKMMEVLLKYSKGIEELRDCKETALRWADEEEVQPVIEMLRRDLGLAPPVRTTVTNDLGRTPLHKAAEAGDVATMRSLVEGSAKDLIDRPCEKGFTPLILAAWRGHDSAVSFLLDYGADTSHRIKGGHTALHKAAVRGNTGVVRQLLDRDPNVDDRTEDDASDTALILAAWCGHRDTTELLLDRGADPLAFNSNGNNGMHVAASRGYADVVLLLLNRGADMRQENSSGWTALGWAAYNGNESLVSEILLHPHNDGWHKNASVKTGMTPVHIAADQGRHGTVGILLDSGADVNAIAKSGKTPLHLAAQKGWVEIAELLLERGAKPDITDEEGNTARQVAENENLNAMVDLLTMVQ